MPRDGASVYHVPAGTTAVTDTTIDSAKYNTFVGDIEQDMNTPRPIVAGGTGASSAPAALVALGGEQAKQIVTNYDSQVFVAGSFYSAAGATSAPVAGHSFSGICYVTDASNMFIEARDQDDVTQPGDKWTRQLKAGVWSAWQSGATAASGRAVYIADTAPVGAPSNSFWWKSDTGILYVHYTDPDNTVPVWVMATPVPDTSIYLPKNGGTMTGTLTLNGNAVNPLDAVPLQQLNAAIAPLAPLASPALTGAPTAPTQPANDNSTKIATTAYADRVVASGTGTGAFVHQSAPVINNMNCQNTGMTSSSGQGPSSSAAIRIYDLGGAQWAGMGCDSGGSRVCVSGTGDHFWGQTSATPFMHLVNGGNLFISGVYSPSDARLKSNVQTLAPSPYFDELRPVAFNWIDEAKGIATQYGLIAQEVEPLAPELITTDMDRLFVNYTNLIAELIAQVQSLKARVATLEGAA